MRKLFVLMSCFVFVILLSGCDNNEDNAVKLGEEFIKKLYTVDDPDRNVNKMSTRKHLEFQDGFSPYLTKDEFHKLIMERAFLTPREVAFWLNNTISIQNISLEEYSGLEKRESLYFNHSFTVIFTNQDGNKVEEEEITGEMTIIDTDDGLKIDRYYDDKNLMNMLNPNK